MSDPAHTGYQHFPDSEDEGPSVPGNRFYVIVEGKTNDAHQSLVSDLRGLGHTPVTTPDQSDYLLVFCPVASRVGTDVTEALKKTPADKPVILVVMHHTFNPDLVIADSRRQVSQPNVRLTVDFLFRDRQLLRCQRNDKAWAAIRRSLAVSRSQVPFWYTIKNLLSNRYLWCGLVLAAIVITASTIIGIELEKKK